MIQNFFYRLGQNIQNRRQKTFLVIGGLVAAILVSWGLLDALFWIGFFGLIIVAPLVIWGATYIPSLAWFWGKDSMPKAATTASASVNGSTEFKSSRRVEGPAEDGDGLEHVPIPDPASIATGTPDPVEGTVAKRCELVRTNPVGTRIIRKSPDEVILEVKSAVRFWCWAAPAISILAAILAFPVGGWLGFKTYEASTPNWQFNARTAAEISFTTALILCAICLSVAVFSYFSTRRYIRVVITPRTIAYGDRRFDRRFSHGLRVGYSNNDTDLPSSILAPRFGVTLVRLTYGRWGEDLRYMINAYHADEIVIWMNEIIDSVGAPPPPRNDPYAGRKIELL